MARRGCGAHIDAYGSYAPACLRAGLEQARVHIAWEAVRQAIPQQSFAHASAPGVPANERSSRLDVVIYGATEPCVAMRRSFCR